MPSYEIHGRRFSQSGYPQYETMNYMKILIRPRKKSFIPIDNKATIV